MRAVSLAIVSAETLLLCYMTNPFDHVSPPGTSKRLDGERISLLHLRRVTVLVQWD